MDALDQLETRIQQRTVTVGVIGLGYVGLPLALRFAEASVSTIGFDIDPKKIDQLQAGRSYINYLAPERIQAATAKHLTLSTDFAAAAHCDALIICVPTPLTRQRDPDLSYVTGTLASIGPHLRAGQILSLESTTYPGTTEELLAPALQRAGLEPGSDAACVYSPERQDPGNPHFDAHNIPKLLGGVTPRCRKLGTALYSLAVEQLVPVSSTKVAEMAKLLENIQRAVNIGLVNEMKLVAERMGVDIFEVVDAAATKPFGFTPFYPGPGLGGHCIPIDPFYLTWKAREFGVNTRFIELAGEINRAMPEHVVQVVERALNEQGKAVRGSRILILGIAYKKNVDDLREAPALELIDRLQQLGATLSYADPHIPTIPPLRRGAYSQTAVSLGAETLSNADCSILCTDHDGFDYELIHKHAACLVDCRGRWRTQARPGLHRA